MEIRILGTGCPNCERLEANVRQAVEEAGIDATIAKVTDANEIVSYGVMSTPALVIDGTVVSYGVVPSASETKLLVVGEAKPEADGSECHRCSCGGHRG